jgi:hypothetical protein
MGALIGIGAIVAMLTVIELWTPAKAIADALAVNLSHC